MTKIEYLEWDSNFFGIRVGRIVVEDESLFDTADFLLQAEQNFDLIYVLSYDKMLSPTKVVSGKLTLKEIMLTLSMPFNKKNFKTGYYNFRTSLTDHELKECYRISEQTSIVSRFYSEPLVGEEKTKLLYRKWIDSALDRSFSDGIFLQKEDDETIGIHLIKTDTVNRVGHFTLTGVNPMLKRKGIGKNLWMQAYAYWAQEGNIDTIKSPFSFKNIESLNFHLKMGFNKVEEIKYIYHWTKKI